MATNLGQYERERFNYGESAGDGKGDYLRTHAIKAEDANTKLFYWLSGGASEVTLPNALPIARGGTGATTAQGVLKNLGYFQDANGQLRRGIKVVSFTDTGLKDQFGNVPTAKFEKVSTGRYKLSGFTQASNLWSFVLPLTYFGLTTIMPRYASVIGDEMILEIYSADFSTWPPREGELRDLLPNETIDIEVK